MFQPDEVRRVARHHGSQAWKSATESVKLTATITTLAVSKGKEFTEEESRALYRLLNTALVKLMLFLFIGLPAIFLGLMAGGGYIISSLHGWSFQQGHYFMASAITGGAIVFPGRELDSVALKVTATFVGAAGICLFAFMVATLSYSVTAPVVHALYQDRIVHSSATAIGKLSAITTVTTAMNILLALAFGGFLAWMEGWTYFTGFKTMANVQLGGGVPFHGMGYPDTEAGITWYCIVGVWGISITAAMISIADGPATEVVAERLGLNLSDNPTFLQASARLALIILLILPMLLLVVMFFVAVTMHFATSWDLKGALWAALPATTGGTAAVSSYENPPLSAFGAVVLIGACGAGFFILSIAIAIGGGLMGPILQKCCLHKHRGVGAGIGLLCLLSIVVVPLLVLVFACPVGAVLSYVEGWAFEDGFWWCVAAQLGGGMPLTKETIHSYLGMWVGTCAAAWSIGIAILTVGVASAPVVEPVMVAMGMYLDSDVFDDIAATFRGKDTSSSHV
eukprot:gnl/TRDRNA2_/TRDRNA2_175542_c0_seq2.p1 gnl/TRDRNA2_/TRDRNA2_175542_c0~~gnl/TRDRNA2_/TRDRNA2_175542_c0_seq2.p1  ORF type:complete len:510 (-),score=61.22 gnl/TRDRNA2_/TRDRNA2_175542_c0_seq2:504-2033(-)